MVEELRELFLPGGVSQQARSSVPLFRAAGLPVSVETLRPNGVLWSLYFQSHCLASVDEVSSQFRVTCAATEH